MSHDPYDINKTYSIGFQGVSALDFIRYKTPTGEWRCLYRTETVNLTGDCLYAHQEGTIYTETSSGTHCFSTLPAGEQSLVTDDGFPIMTDGGSQIVRDVQEIVTDTDDNITADTGDIIVNY